MFFGLNCKTFYKRNRCCQLILAKSNVWRLGWETNLIVEFYLGEIQVLNSTDSVSWSSLWQQVLEKSSLPDQIEFITEDQFVQHKNITINYN